MRNKTTALGAISLFIFTQKKAEELNGFKLSATQIGEIVALDPASMSMWKKGNRKPSSVYFFISLSNYLECSISLLIDIATERDMSHLDIFSQDLARIRLRRNHHEK